MVSAFEQELEEEPKDKVKWIWVGVLVAFVLMLAALWFSQSKSASFSQVRARHILIQFSAGDALDRARALELVTDLRKRILNGENMAKLAKDYSNDTFSSQRGGDLGYQKRGIYEPKFEEYVWSAPLHQLSDIIQTTHGFHLVIVEDRIVSKADEYEENLQKKVVPVTK